MKYNIYTFVWDTFEILYRITGLRWQRPFEYFKPDLCEWLFDKMSGFDKSDNKELEGGK